jgi:raffinose/stachyose/melibiose transport system permease protein
MDKILKDKKALMLFILPPAIIYLGIVIIPTIWSIVYSFYTGMMGIDFRFTGLSNYIKIWSDQDFLDSMAFTLKYVGIMVIFQVGLGLLLAFLFHFGVEKYKSMVRTVVFFPVVLPIIAVGQLFSKIYEITPQYGLLNSVLHLLGLNGLVQAWTGQVSTAMGALCVMDIWTSIGFYAVIFYAALVNIPDDLIEAAEIDGAKPVRLAWNIIMPLLKPITCTCLVFSLTGTIKVYESIVALTGGGPGQATQSLSVYMYKTAFTYTDYGYASTIAVIMLVLSVVVMLAVNKLFASKDEQ